MNRKTGRVPESTYGSIVFVFLSRQGGVYPGSCCVYRGSCCVMQCSAPSPQMKSPQ